jgi:hypothetical protein
MKLRLGIKKKTVAIAVAGIVAATTGIVLVAGPAEASANYGYSGFSHGTYVYTGLANSSPQVASFFGCTKKVGIYRENTAATVNLNGQALAGTVETKTYTHNDSRGDGTTSYGTAQNIKVGPLLEILGASSFSRAVRKDGAFKVTAWSHFGQIKIGGVPLPSSALNPAPNTKYDVPGLGYVVFNRVVNSVGTSGASASSAAVLIHSTMDNPFYPKGSTIAVLLTKAQVGGNRIGLLRGNAFALKASAGGILKSGPWSYQTTCMGTNGQVVTVDVSGVTVPNGAVANGLSTSQAGVIRSDLISGWMSSRVNGVNLGNGQVKISGLAARAVATKTAQGTYPTAVSSSIGSLTIGGQTAPIPQLPNQRVDIPGLGYIIFNKQVKKTGYVSVTAVEVHLTALSTVIELAHAEAGIVS